MTDPIPIRKQADDEAQKAPAVKQKPAPAKPAPANSLQSKIDHPGFGVGRRRSWVHSWRDW